MFGTPTGNEKQWPTEKMKEVAPPIQADNKPMSEGNWLLNLDAIQSNSGEILFKNRVSDSDLNGSIMAFSSEHVLYSKLRPYLNKVAVPDEPGYGTTELIPLLPDKSKLTRLYLAHLLRSDAFVSKFSSAVAGTKMPRVSMDVFWKFEVPVPPIDLQQDFGSFVEQVNKSKVVQPTTTKSRFIEMFGNPVTNEKGWTVDTIENLFDVRGRVGWKGYTKNDLVSEGPLVIGGSEIEGGIVVFKNPVHLSKEKYVESPEIMVQQNDLIIASRGTIGTCAIVSQNFGEVTINPCVILMRPKGVNSNFFVRLFNMPQVQSTLKEIGSGAVQPMISQGNLKKFKIIVPPTSLQDSFMRFIQQVDKSKVAISGV